MRKLDRKYSPKTGLSRSEMRKTHGGDPGRTKSVSEAIRVPNGTEIPIGVFSFQSY